MRAVTFRVIFPTGIRGEGAQGEFCAGQWKYVIVWSDAWTSFPEAAFAQSKLVRVVKGRVLDVAVDIRKGSPTYGEHVAVELSEDNHLQFFIPKGFAHGFAVLSEVAVFQYKCDNYYAPQADGGISILDEGIGIDWKIPADKAILSEKDTKHPLLRDFESPFE